MESLTKSSTSKQLTVFIEGNIGSGKTKFLDHFSQFKNVSIVSEPIELWQNLNGLNLLDMLYKDYHRWAMTVQSYVTLTALKNHLKMTDKPIKLMERSLYCGRFCFVEQMFANKALHEGMYHVLQEWYDFIFEHHHIQCDLIIYLRSTPEIVYERMQNRGRVEESKVSLKYLKELHDLHENWLIHKKFHCPATVLVINADLTLDEMAAEYSRAEKIIVKEASKLTKNLNYF